MTVHGIAIITNEIEITFWLERKLANKETEVRRQKRRRKQTVTVDFVSFAVGSRPRLGGSGSTVLFGV